MGHTNETSNVGLSQFLGTDKPAWLVDYNGDMAKIDAYAYATKVKADANEGAIASVSGRVTAVENTISNTITPALNSATNNISILQGNITTINSLIGNGTPTTTDQTIIGAINEINANLMNNNFDSTVTINGVYTSSSNVYTCPSDGIVHVLVEPSGASIGHILDANESGYEIVIGMAVNNTGGLCAFSQYVKKGMKIYHTGADTCKFLPFKA